MSESDYLRIIGDNIKRLRESKGLSINELSKRAGISKSTLSLIEAGKSNPTISTLWAIADALEVPFSELVEPSLVISEDNVNVRLIERVGSTEVYLMKLSKGSVRRAKPHRGNVTEYVVVVEGSLITGVISEPKYVKAVSIHSFRGDVEHIYIAPEVDSLAVVILKYGGGGGREG